MAPVVGLYGIGGTYNYGCEAIVRGTALLLRAVWPGVRIVYPSSMPEYDRLALADLDIEISPRSTHARFSLPRLSAAAARRIGLPGRYQAYHEAVDWLEPCDMVLSIGGDMYTLSMAYHLAHLAEIVQGRGKKFIIWGASIGPLPPGDPEVLLGHFRRADLITSREPETTRFLASHGIQDNVVEAADPAFAVSSEPVATVSKRDRPRVALNLSPLTLADSCAAGPGAALQRQADFVAALVERYRVEIVLVPHVVTEELLQDDDLRHLQAVRERIAPHIAPAVTLAETRGGFRSAKAVLRQCDLVIASRMHCAINAASEGVPVLFAAYSQKAHGMCEYLYGNREWVLSLEALLDGGGVAAVGRLLDNLPAVREQLAQRMAAVRRERFQAQDRLLQLGY